MLRFLGMGGTRAVYRRASQVGPYRARPALHAWESGLGWWAKGFVWVLVIGTVGLVLRPNTAVPVSTDGLPPLIRLPFTPGFRSGEITINPRATLSPRKTYELELWDLLYGIAPAKGNYRTAVEDSIAEFQKAHPNVKVKVTWLDPKGLDEQLHSQLAAGSPPDVVGLDTVLSVESERMQIPVDPYLAKDETLLYMPGTLDGVRYEGRSWAWPRWANWWVVGTRTSVLAAEGLDVNPWLQSGWSWSDLVERTFNTIAGKGKSKGSLAVDVESPTWWILWLRAKSEADEDGQGSRTGKQKVTGKSDGDLWERGVTESIHAVQKLVREKRMSSAAGEMARTRLSKLVGGGVTFAAPLNAWAVGRLIELEQSVGAGGTSAGTGGTPVESTLQFLPLPSVSGQAAPFFSVAASGYAVFRQDEYRGDDHTRAAVELARHLSRSMGAWMSSRSALLPALAASLPDWESGSKLPESLQTVLVRSVNDGLPTLSSPDLRQRALEAADQLGKEADALLSGRVTTEQIQEWLKPDVPVPPSNESATFSDPKV